MNISTLEAQFQALIQNYLESKISPFSYMVNSVRLGRMIRAAQEA